MGKESTCNVGDARQAGSVPESERSSGGGHGNPLQYSCLEMQDMQVLTLGRKDPLEEDMATHYSILV